MVCVSNKGYLRKEKVMDLKERCFTSVTMDNQTAKIVWVIYLGQSFWIHTQRTVFYLGYNGQPNSKNSVGN